MKNLRGGWEFDEEAYFADGGYASELIDVGRDQGVHVFEADGLLYCYPSLLRLLPADPAVRIDKTVERRIRPTVLVNHLRDVQRRGAKFKEAAFLESLYAAFRRGDVDFILEMRDYTAFMDIAAYAAAFR